MNLRRKLMCLRLRLARMTLPLPQQRATFDWPAWTTAFVQIQICFRSEFRPLGSLSLSFFTCLTSVQRKLCPHWSLGPLAVVVFWGVCGLVVCLLLSCSSPLTNMQSFYPSHDDLGTPPTWRPHSWKKTERCSIDLPKWGSFTTQNALQYYL